ncbi:Trigger factor [Bienertia sinuspersici]
MDKIISWNVRGANNLDKQIGIRSFLQTQGVGLVGLLETKVKPHNLGSLYKRIFDGWCCSSNGLNHGKGRIIVAWNPLSFSVQIQDCIAQTIHLYPQPRSGALTFYCTMVYAYNSAQERQKLWKDLKRYKAESQGAWILMRDLNCVLNYDERIVKKEIKELNKNKFNRVQAAAEEAYNALIQAQKDLHGDPQNWIQESDKNNRLFHRILKVQTLKSNLYSIQDMEGKIQNNPQDIAKAFMQYYKELIGTPENPISQDHYHPKLDCSWYWKKLCEVRNQLCIQGMSSDNMAN